MYAIREIKTVINNSVFLNLPDYLENQKVEIIILPFKESKQQERTNPDTKNLSLQEILLNAPVISKEELNNLKEIRRNLNKWKPKQF